MSPYLAAEDLSMFGTDPWWLVVLKAVFCFAFLMVTVLISIVMERKVVAWMQPVSYTHLTLPTICSV